MSVFMLPLERTQGHFKREAFNFWGLNASIFVTFFLIGPEEMSLFVCIRTSYNEVYGMYAAYNGACNSGNE